MSLSLLVLAFELSELRRKTYGPRVQIDDWISLVAPKVMRYFPRNRLTL